MSKTDWEKAQDWEMAWHDNCINSFHEEEKQLVYAEKMGLVRKPTPKTPVNFDLGGISVLDIGGGAYSLLLKCVNFSEATVADPLMHRYPKWVLERYKELGVTPLSAKGEDLENAKPVDEVWIYNVLEHCEDPYKVVQNAKKLGKIIRFFEWIDTTRGVNVGHIHAFTRDKLNKWLGGEGKVEMFNRSGAVGKGYFGIFLGDNYASPIS